MALSICLHKYIYVFIPSFSQSVPHPLATGHHSLNVIQCVCLAIAKRSIGNSELIIVIINCCTDDMAINDSPNFIHLIWLNSS